ncbi:MAG: glycoside hydrolase domain-containing protein, partial [Actinomycetota bacterium]
MRVRHALRALIAAAACAVAAPAVATADQAWPLGSGQKVFPESQRPAAVPAALTLGAGQDEYEGGIVAVRLDGGGSVPAKVSDLVGPGTIPGASVERFRVGYVPVTKTSTGVDALESSRYPDPLIPLAPGEPLQANAGETTGLYLLVHVPAGAPAGRYTGSVDLGAAGNVPVELDVVAVPVSRDGYQVVGRLEPLSLAAALGVEEGDPALRAGVYDTLLPMLRRHGVSPSQVPFGRPRIDEATWAADFTNKPWNPVSDNIDRVLAMGFPRIEIPFLPLYGPIDDRSYSQDAKRRTYAQGLAARFGPVAGRTFALPVDEPKTEEYPVVRRASAQLKSANPALPVMVTEAPSPEALTGLSSAVDIWAPPLWSFYQYRSAIEKVRAQGKDVWWYVYGSDTQRFTPNFLIDKPTTEARVNGWLAAREGVQGMFYWSLNSWRPGKVYQDPWTTPWRLSHVKQADTCGGAAREVGGNGEASLLYPGPGPATPAYGSLRLEALRDGIEDHSLLLSLKARDPAYYQRIVDGVSRPYSGEHTGFDPCKPTNRPPYLPVVATDPGDIDAARTAVLRRLSGGRLVTLRGRVVRGGKPVAGAVVRFGIFRTVTDANGEFVLPDVPPVPGTIVISRDPEGVVDRIETAVTPEMVASDEVAVAPPPLPARPTRAVSGLGRFTARRTPARARMVGRRLEMTIARRYTPAGRELPAELHTPPEVEAWYPRGAAGRKDRSWAGWRYLEFDVEVTRPSAADQPWRLVVTPGNWRSARYLVVGQTRQHLRLDLTGLPLRDVRYLRFGIESALP